jgi:AbrB family looped-hinge helix DNA binding protein
METVTVSPKFQVVIPLSIRTALQLVPGEKLRFLRHTNRVEFIRVRPIREMRGFLKDMDTGIDREGDRLSARKMSSTLPVGLNTSQTLSGLPFLLLQ